MSSDLAKEQIEQIKLKHTKGFSFWGWVIRLVTLTTAFTMVMIYLKDQKSQTPTQETQTNSNQTSSSRDKSKNKETKRPEMKIPVSRSK